MHLLVGGEQATEAVPVTRNGKVDGERQNGQTTEQTMVLDPPVVAQPVIE